MYDPKVVEQDDLDELYLKMTTETIELFESKDCAMVLDQCLDSTLEFVVDSLAGHFLGNEGKLDVLLMCILILQLHVKIIFCGIFNFTVF